MIDLLIEGPAVSQLDLVVGTSDGLLWAVRGDDGSTLRHWPVRTGGRIVSPALLLTLARAPSELWRTLVAPGADGAEDDASPGGGVFA